MNKVYIVTQGDYSDYRIEAVYTDKKMADEYARRGGDDYTVEERKLNAPIPRVQIGVIMNKNGEARAYQTFGQRRGLRWFFGDDLWWAVNTDDKERAIKVVNEKRTQILALGIWGDEAKVREMVKQ